jgi:hypothetical protein
MNKKQTSIIGSQHGGLDVHCDISAQLDVGGGRRLGEMEGHSDFRVVARREDSEHGGVNSGSSSRIIGSSSAQLWCVAATTSLFSHVPPSAVLMVLSMLS